LVNGKRHLSVHQDAAHIGLSTMGEIR